MPSSLMGSGPRSPAGLPGVGIADVLPLYQRPCPLTVYVRQGRWYLIDFARGRPTNPARIPVVPSGRWYNLAVSVASTSWWAKHVPGEGQGAHHPRLSAVSTPPGVDAGPPRHDVVATTVPPADQVSAHSACPGHPSRRRCLN